MDMTNRVTMEEKSPSVTAPPQFWAEYRVNSTLSTDTYVSIFHKKEASTAQLLLSFGDLESKQITITYNRQTH
jgi:hypothetical protein